MEDLIKRDDVKAQLDRANYLLTEAEEALAPFAHSGDWIRSTDYDRAFLTLQAIKQRSPRVSVWEECAVIAERACLVPPDGGSPTKEEVDLCNSIAKQIRDRAELRR